MDFRELAGRPIYVRSCPGRRARREIKIHSEKDVSRRWSLYLIRGTDGFEVKLCQSLNDIAAALKEIFPYERSESEELFARVAVLVNDLHLLDYCRLARLARTCRRETVWL